MGKLVNLARMTTATTGTGDITLGSAVAGFLSFAAAGVSDADVVTYAISDGSASEIGTATYVASGTQIQTRTVLKSTNGDAAINLSGTAEVMITVSAEDVLNKTTTAAQTIASPLSVGTSNAVTAGTIELGHASDTTIARSAAGAITVEGVAVKTAGVETIWVPAASMTARTTNGAEIGTTELTTNDVMLRSLDFNTATEEGAGFMIAMPKSWNEGTVTFAPYWTAASGSGTVVFGLAAYAFSNDDALDTAVSGQQTSTDTLITANDCHIGPTSSAITIGGTPAENDLVYFEITREVASDTLGVDAKLLGIRLHITTDASTDA